MQFEGTFSSKSRFIELGAFGHVGIFFWLLGAVMLLPAEKWIWTAALCLLVIIIVYPKSFQRLKNPRMFWLYPIILLPPAFFFGEVDQALWGIPYSSTGLITGLQALVRLIVVVLVVQGFTQKVDIPTLTGLLERLGIKGLGFSIGIALNLLPSLRDAWTTSWHSLKMRGGFRKKWLRGGQLLIIVVITNAIRRAEEITLAAEARGFSPDRTYPLEIKHTHLDWLVIPVSILSILAILYLI